MKTIVLALVLSGCASTLVTERVSPVRTDPGRPGAVLFVLSSAPIQTLADGSTRSTGYFLSEMYDALVVVEDMGLAIEFVTPSGAPAVIDPESLQEKYWPDIDTRTRAENRARKIVPISAKAALERADEYSGLVIVGGQGVMIDVVASPEVASLVVAFADRPLGLICHAPAILARVPTAKFAGRVVTSVSGFEEWFIETFIMGSEAVDRGIHDQLEDKGFEYESALPGRAFAVRDGNLVTSQNPYSGEAFGELYRSAMNAYLGRP